MKTYEKQTIQALFLEHDFQGATEAQYDAIDSAARELGQARLDAITAAKQVERDLADATMRLALCSPPIGDCIARNSSSADYSQALTRIEARQGTLDALLAAVFGAEAPRQYRARLRAVIADAQHQAALERESAAQGKPAV